MYTKYPNKKEMPSRLARKGNRNKVFQANRQASKKLRALRAQKRQAQAESSVQEE
jgi:hypothetical protein